MHRILSLGLLIVVLTGCSSIHDSESSTYTADPICSKIKQRLAGSATENIPSARTVNATERADLMQEFHELGCQENTDDAADEVD